MSARQAAGGRHDALVLGAGIVGISAALHLQERGRTVVLVDRREPGRETSYGNAGLIETSAVLPHPFPKGLSTLLRLALNRTDAVRTDYRFLPQILPWLIAYRRASGTRRLNEIGTPFRSLIAASLPEHRHLMQQAGASDLLREDGWLELARTPGELDAADRCAILARDHGIRAIRLERNALRAMEPGLRQDFAGAIHWADTARIVDPGALLARLFALFLARGGLFLQGDALALQRADGGWNLQAGQNPVSARDAVVTLGPWSGDLVRRLGYDLPLVAKRGYHQHFADHGANPLQRPIYVRDRSCLIVPMAQGVRVMTGVELAGRDAAPTPLQLARMVACARQTLDLGPAVEDRPWLGARPCLPDMLPVIGAAPRQKGLWFAFGHGHYGLTQGPASGRLIAEMVAGQVPFLPVDAFAPGRFARQEQQARKTIRENGRMPLPASQVRN